MVRLFLAGSLLIFSASTTAAAGEKPCHGRVTCPRCDACCELQCIPDTKKKNCWLVECEQICVPRIVFPWQTRKACQGDCDGSKKGGACCCVNNGAWVRTVKRLKKHTVECPTCKYKWTPRHPGKGSLDEVQRDGKLVAPTRLPPLAPASSRRLRSGPQAYPKGHPKAHPVVKPAAVPTPQTAIRLAPLPPSASGLRSLPALNQVVPASAARLTPGRSRPKPAPRLTHPAIVKPQGPILRQPILDTP